MTKLIRAEHWAPKGIPGMEAAALAVVKSDSDYLVVAGPGAGKTEMLAQRASFLLETGLCAYPSRVLAISFKRDAAKNLRDRVERRCGAAIARRFESYTFDAWSKSILDRFRLALPASFRPTKDYVIDMNLGKSAPLQQRLLAIAEQAGVAAGKIYQIDVEKFYRKWVRATPINVNAEVSPGTSWGLTYGLWQNVLFGRDRSVLDFAMISSLAELLLRTNIRLLTALRLSYRYVFLDEFQDTTTSQFALLSTAFKDSEARITAVGDNKQRIMLWAGAQRDVFEVFLETFEAKKRSLKVNYRSAPRLIAIQNQLIEEMEGSAEAAMQPPAGLGDGGECRVLVFENDDAEAQYVAALIDTWVREQGISSEDICILVRALPGPAATVLFPYLAAYGLAARAQDTLQDLLTEPLTRLVIDTASVCCEAHAPDNWDNLRHTVLELQGIEEGSAAMRKVTRGLSEAIAQQRPALEASSTIDELIAWINSVLDYVGRSSFVLHHERYIQSDFLNKTIRQCAEVLIEARARCGDWSSAIADFLGAGYIPVMSIHKSKGLEFHSVVLLGLEDWPFRGISKGDGEEECAVFVAFSRAKQRVIITSAEARQGRAQSRDDVAKFFNAFERAGVVPETL